jgi:ABC-2 type transport system permease protein
MAILLHLLRYKILSFFKTTFDLRLVAVVRGVGSLIVFGGFAASAYYLSSTLTEYILDNTRIGLYLFHRFISMMLFVFFMAVNLGNIIVSFATLYKSTEVMYLLTKPVSYTTIFVLKFLDNFLYSSTTLFLVGFMVLLGYGTYFGYEWYTLLGVLVFVLVPFMFLSACAAVLVLMAIMKAASQVGFRKIVTMLSALYVLIVILFFRFSNPIQLVADVNRYYPNVDAYMMSLDPGMFAYLPNHWVSEFLFYMARGEMSQALPILGILLGVTAAAFVLCLMVANRFYFRSWVARYQFKSESNQPAAHRKPRFFAFRNPSSFSPHVEVMLKKEYFHFIREPSQGIHFGLMVVLLALFVMSVGSVRISLGDVNIRLVTYLVMFGFGAFLASSLALRFVFPMVSLEGKAFWSILSAPIDVRRVYWIKFIVSFIVVLLMAQVIAVFSNLPYVRYSPRTPLLMYFGIFTTFWISLALTSLNLGFGGYFANYSENNPIRVSSSQGATLTFLVSLLFLIGIVVLVVLPLNLYFTSLFLFTPFDRQVIVVPGTAMAVLSMVLALIAYAIGVRSLKRDF